MSWFKKAQQLEVTDSENIKGKGKNYTDYGHDIYYEKQNRLLDTVNKKYQDKQPNILWIYQNGQIETKPETEMAQTHRSKENWDLSSHMDRLYTGRYSPSEKVITIIPPHEGVGKFTEVPKSLQFALYQTFPDAKKMIRYGTSNNLLKQAQQIPPISIISYDNYEDLTISFNGGKKYIYPNVTPDDYNYIRKLLRVKNYKKVQEILKNISANRPDTEEDKQQMLNQLYNEGHLT